MTQAIEAYQRVAVRVRVVETANGVTGEARVAASFPREAAAADFIRAELMKWKSFGCHEGHNWGRNTADHHVRYWTETQQETASVREDRVHDGNAAAAG
jgi:hypothetical protein